ncbi:hypothetical protein E2C01_100163 [Portunus trituberculatus]|uniref:Uncharacterized protein n=1 Tax=Portunus trituberculatus TaxID=210409 RepID=A0A5B7K7B8_PORTR|nr:hypothetical protein [Portunus trituberculatus]
MRPTPASSPGLPHATTDKDIHSAPSHFDTTTHSLEIHLTITWTV